jgi:GT2 family glycosyltransferase
MLTYNQLDDTKLCVESLFKHTADVNYELIFVDNGSTKDDTIAYLDNLKKEHKNIKTIYNKENLGFACANNQGIELAEGDYVLLLNNDVILTDGWLSRMINIAESDSKIGVVAPCTNHASGRQVVTFAGTEEDDEGIQKFAKETLLKKAGNWISVSRIIGFCMLIKREVLFKVGVLDEMFGPGGYEDYDYCMRVKHENYDIVIALDTFIFHIGGKGYSSNNMDYMNLRSKNIELLIDKWTRNMLEIMEKLPDGMK